MTEKDEAVAYTIKKLEKRIMLLERALHSMLEGTRSELETTKPGRLLIKANEELLGNFESEGKLLDELAEKLAVADYLGFLPD